MNARENLIKTGYDLFLKQGYLGTGIAEVLKVANLSKGGFYHHFDSKLDLLKAVVETYMPLPFGDIDWPEHRAQSVQQQQQRIRQEYRQLDQIFASMNGQIMRYFAFFFDALSHLDDFKTAVDGIYANAISSLAAAHERHPETNRKQAYQQAREFFAQFEGEVFLRAVTTKPKEFE